MCMNWMEQTIVIWGGRVAQGRNGLCRDAPESQSSAYLPHAIFQPGRVDPADAQSNAGASAFTELITSIRGLLIAPVRSLQQPLQQQRHPLQQQQLRLQRQWRP